MIETALRPQIRSLVLCASLALIAGCSTGQPQFGGSRPQQAEAGVYEALTRWIHRNYDASNAIGTPAAWCLATGRYAFRADDRYRRGEEERWNPDPRLLELLNDLEPPVVPVSDCWRSDQTQEQLGRDGPSAVLLLMEQPNWTSSNTARIEMRTYENNSYRYQYDCRMEQQRVVWRVLECV